MQKFRKNKKKTGEIIYFAAVSAVLPENNRRKVIVAEFFKSGIGKRQKEKLPEAVFLFACQTI